MVGKLVQFGELSKPIQDLIEESIAVRELAYCPYSNFKVGAAVLTKNGTIFNGCNVENASYGLTICAERTAIVKAVSSNILEFYAVAVSGSIDGETLPPCGQCRQFVAEFSKKNDVLFYLTLPDKKKIVETSIRSTYSGCNVENAAYALSICAERTALVKAVSSCDQKEFSVIAVCGRLEGGATIAPCGACRQFIVEFVTEFDITIYLTDPDKKKVLQTTITL